MTKSDKKTNLDKWLALKKKAATTAKPSGIQKMPEGIAAPLSHGQQRLWLLQQLYPDNPFYNYAHRYHFKGTLDAEQLLESFQVVAAKQQALRTNFEEKNGQLVQVIQTAEKIPVAFSDLSALAGKIKNQKLEEITQDALGFTFDLTKDILLRLTLIKLSETEHILLLLMHHIIGDRSSLQILNAEVATHYKGQNFESALDIQYQDFAYWQSQQKTKESDLNYWKKQLGRELPILKLPTDFKRPNKPSFRGEILKKELSTSLSEQLKTLAKSQKTTLFVLGLAAFKVLLSRYTGQMDVLIGAPFSNRDKTSLERLIGFFNETIVLRSDLSAAPTFIQLLEQLKQTTLDAFAHKNIPFETLVKELKPERQGTSNPIFQAMFVFNDHSQTVDFGTDLEVQEEAIDLGVSKFDLSLFLSDEGEKISLGLEYESDLFAPDTIERMLGHLEVLLTEISKNPNQAITHYDLLTAKEEEQILIDWNNTQNDIPNVETIHRLFERQVAQHPERIAVSFQETTLTYTELHTKANSIAQALRKLGDLRNRLVGLYVTPSTDMLVGILGVLKAGAAYLPLDPNYPQERIDYMLEDAEVAVVLTQTELVSSLKIKDIPVFEIEKTTEFPLENLPKIESKASDLAYMIYTSGSTGKPKGVPISHHNLIHSTVARFHFYDKQPSAFLLLSSFAFDSSIAGIFWTICCGGKLVFTPKRIEQDINALTEIIAQQKVTHTLLLPSLYSVLLEYAPLQKMQSLQTVMVAGEACTAKLVEQHFDKSNDTLLYNEYGPTEGTVWSTAHRIEAIDAKNAVPIGRPIPNVSNYILDAHQQLVPVGVVGELYISGKGIAKGYWKRPELTAEKFLENPFDVDRLYKTGDLARFRVDGTIEFLGRADQQIKIRGHRVELGEIERTILQIPLVKDVVVLIDEHQRLRAYLLAEDDLNKLGARHWLSSKLPDYMLPSSLVVVEDFPRLPNGKIDQKTLAKIQQAPKNTEEEVPANELETQLLDIWKAVLKTENISLTDNFFEIGGDSIQSIQVIAKAQKQNISIAPNHLFEYQSVRALAQFLSMQDKNVEEWTSLATFQKGGNNTPLFCIHSGAAHVFFYRNLANYLGENQALYALQPKGLDGKLARHNSIEEMASFYIEEIKKVQPEGPYAILGTCFSNAVGLEMAQQLQAAGDEIETLVFVDSGPAHLQSLEERGGKRTLHRFGKMLKAGNWQAIKRKFRNRAIVATQKATESFKDEQAQNLQRTINNLNRLYATYNWQAFDGKVTFIRSSEFAARADKQFHIDQWTKLAKQGLEVHVVEGHHVTLFEEPEVQGLATVLREVMKV